jgi:GTP-binding protein Era
VNDREIDEEIIEKVNGLDIPVIFALNKIDTREQSEVAGEIHYWQDKIKEACVIPMSALHGFNTTVVKEKVTENLPDSPPFYEKDSLTDRSLRFFISEIIRESLLTQYRKEIPYSVEVVVNEYKDQAKIVRISAVIYVERESQRKIIIGKDGKAIKGLGISARQEIEKFIDKKVFLDLSVKVSKDWRNDDQKLKSFGYPVD